MAQEKPAWLYRQSGVIPYRRRNRQLQVLLITSRRQKRWIIPKGVIERHLTPVESAAKEAYEEAGVIGTTSDEPVGQYEYEKWGGICVVTVFPMQVREVLPPAAWLEAEERERRWYSMEEAIALVEEAGLRQVLGDFG